LAQRNGLVSDRGEVESQARRVAAAAQREIATFEVPSWLRTVGLGSWYVLAIVVVAAVVLLVLALVTEVAIPLVIAAVLAAILVPLTDRLEGWHVPRWLGATLVLVLALGVVAATIALVINGIVSQSDEIWEELQSGLQQVNTDVGGGTSSGETVVDGARSAVRVLTSGVVGSLVSSAGSLIVSTVLAVFMLLFLLKDWYPITDWTARHLGVPASTGHSILDGVVNAFRGYASGLTLIGTANAVVVGVGAWILDVPLVGTIALVTFVTSYVPYLGAFVAGGFAVLIAYGSGGLGTALAMVAIVLLANNTVQNLLEPFAFGTRLRLHPLVVLITVTSATVLFGVLGAVLAAPLASAAVNAYNQLRDIGLLDATTSPTSEPVGDDQITRPTPGDDSGGQ
jgi:predicted PurR-regulated permease PerM